MKTSEIFKVQNLDLRLQVEEEFLPKLRKCCDELNAALLKANDGQKLMLPGNETTRKMIYALLEVIYERDAAAANSAEISETKQRLNDLANLCDSALNQS